MRADIKGLVHAQVGDCVRIKPDCTDSLDFNADDIECYRDFDGTVINVIGDAGLCVVRFSDGAGAVGPPGVGLRDHTGLMGDWDLDNATLDKRRDEASQQQRQIAAQVIFAVEMVRLDEIGLIAVERPLWDAFVDMARETDFGDDGPREASNDFLRSYTQEYRRAHPSSSA